MPPSPVSGAQPTALSWLGEPPRGGADRLREIAGRLPAGSLGTAALVLPALLVAGGSTATAGWVPGTGEVPALALAAGLALGAAAVALPRRLPPGPGLAPGLAAGPLVAYVAAAPALRAAHPHDPLDPGGQIAVWAPRLASGEALADPAFVLLLILLGAWLGGGWLSWCALRWRRPLLGLAPVAVALVTNVLNFPAGQNGYALGFLLLTLALLLWSTYVRSKEAGRRAGLRLSQHARWDFWQAGVVAGAALLAAGVLLPPLSTADRTAGLQNQAFDGWDGLVQRLDEQRTFGLGAGGTVSIGLDLSARLGGPLRQTGGVVLTYAAEAGYRGPRYFRAFNLTLTEAGAQGPEWRYSDGLGAVRAIAPDRPVPYVERYRDQAAGRIEVRVLRPPRAARDVLVYPGSLVTVSLPALARTGLARAPAGGSGTAGLATLDELVAASGPAGRDYSVTSAYSTATEDELRTAGTDYPAWLNPYRNFAGSPAPPAAGAVATNYLAAATLERIHQLALRVTAGQPDPYDEAEALERYLRTGFTYTLSPPPAPAGTDALDYFLFDSRRGYCQYFATAMGDMLRSLAIPTRLVNGYGPGVYDQSRGRWVVREADAHTWVEAYFPGYGWVPFEPTPDGVYFPIPRGDVAATCAHDSRACDPGPATGRAGAGTGRRVGARPDRDRGGMPILGLGGAAWVLSPLRLAPALAILLLIGAGLWLAVRRYLRPRTPGAAWDRLLRLAALAGLPAGAAETPLELGGRLGRELPAAATALAELGRAFAIAAYAPPGAAAAAGPAVLGAWAAARPVLVRRVRGRLLRAALGRPAHRRRTGGYG